MTASDPWQQAERRMVGKLILALGLMAVCMVLDTQAVLIGATRRIFHGG